MDTPTTLKDLKAALTAGRKVLVTDHIHPALNGERTVVKAQTKSLCLSLPEGHPNAANTDGSWLDWPKARDLTFSVDNGRWIATILQSPEWQAARKSESPVLMRLSIV